MNLHKYISLSKEKLQIYEWNSELSLCTFLHTMMQFLDTEKIKHKKQFYRESYENILYKFLQTFDQIVFTFGHEVKGKVKGTFEH